MWSTSSVRIRLSGVFARMRLVYSVSTRWTGPEGDCARSGTRASITVETRANTETLPIAKNRDLIVDSRRSERATPIGGYSTPRLAGTSVRPGGRLTVLGGTIGRTH